MCAYTVLLQARKLAILNCLKNKLVQHNIKIMDTVYNSVKYLMQYFLQSFHKEENIQIYTYIHNIFFI